MVVAEPILGPADDLAVVVNIIPQVIEQRSARVVLRQPVAPARQPVIECLRLLRQNLA